MAEALLQVLIKNLSSLIEKEIGSIMSVDEEMKKLSSTLTTIQKVLEDAEDKQLQSEPIQNWLSKLKDIAYETEDIVDECATEVSKLKHKGRFNLTKILHGRKIGRRVKEIAKKLDAVAAERHKFHLREKDVSQSREVDAGRKTGSILNEPDHIYGRDEDKEKIVDMLVNQVTDCQQLSVLPIIGIGGLGKTTLAQLVYNDERVTQHFDIKLWVCVSDNFNVELLLKAMIESATGSASDLVTLDALQRRLWEVLSRKRYLLILDDVWSDNQESWAKLKSILACGSKGASVVVTTRLKKVADIMGTLKAHRLTGLSEEDCWVLLRRRAFGEENEEHPNLENIGRQIVKKCAGVPLAAKALGGLLRFKRREEEWIHVRESEIWNFSEEEDLILPALRLSYRHLPLTLRRCFVYCAVFPKDTRIEKQDLIFHWMAHGCISSATGSASDLVTLDALLYETPWDVPKIPSCKFSYPDFILEASGDNWRRMYVAKSETLRAESHSHQQSNSRFFRLVRLVVNVRLWMDRAKNWFYVGKVKSTSKLDEKGPSLEEYDELADALAESNRSFIWVIQPGSGRPGPPANFFGVKPASNSKEEGYYPHGMEERVGDRGLIIKGWAPQLSILSHPSTGGFLSHCGWNSTIEAIGCGIPILAWPIRGDQFYDAKLVVKYLKVGHMVSSGDNLSEMVKKFDIMQGIEVLMDDGEVHDQAVALRGIFKAGYPSSSGASLKALIELISK